MSGFQRDRGLRVTGSCDETTWRALIEAGWRLGDRLLMVVAPNLRGDDIADMQAMLARIGFDPGRADGIFGADTARALSDFQRNIGVPADGVCGPDTVRALEILARQSGTGPGVTVVRELERLNEDASSFEDLRVLVGQFGGLSSVARQLVQALRQRSATVIATDEPDAVTQAAAANRFGATVYVGLETTVGDQNTIHYFQVPQFESTGGRRLAEFVADRAADLITDFHPEVVGMRLPVLRETKMPAILLVIGSVETALDQAPVIVRCIIDGLQAWMTTAVDSSQ